MTMHSPPPCAALPAAEHSAYGHGYERMRRHAVEPGAGHGRHGLAVVALRGVAACCMPSPNCPPRRPPFAAALPRSRCPPTSKGR